jgi:Glycosyltransferase family 28 C-terminal domain
MDEILLANYMVVDDLLDQEHYDLVIGDKAWEVDHYLHQNPDRKQTAYAWLTDFVGWLPMPDGGPTRPSSPPTTTPRCWSTSPASPAYATDRAIYVGNPHDLVPDSFGPDLPSIRDWTRDHYDFAGYVTGFHPAALGDRQELRQRLGYHPDQQVCVVTVGGTGVGAALLRRVIDAFPLARRAVPELRMIVVAGPRIDPASLPAGRQEGLELRAFVPDLYRHLAACDLAIIQGGLTTAMELTANRRPFLYFPLAHHFEQHYHVPTAWTATGPASAWTTPPPTPTPPPPPSPARSAARSTTNPSNTTAPTRPPPCSPNYSESPCDLWQTDPAARCEDAPHVSWRRARLLTGVAAARTPRPPPRGNPTFVPTDDQAGQGLLKPSRASTRSKVWGCSQRSGERRSQWSPQGLCSWG